MLDNIEEQERTPEEIHNVSMFLDLRDKMTHYANLKAKEDFLTFVKIFAPTIVSHHEISYGLSSPTFFQVSNM